MKDVNGKEIKEGDKLFTIQGWEGRAERDNDNNDQLVCEFKKWCGAFVRRISISEETIKAYDIKVVS
jgi:hypothetical protein